MPEIFTSTAARIRGVPDFARTSCTFPSGAKSLNCGIHFPFDHISFIFSHRSSTCDPVLAQIVQELGRAILGRKIFAMSSFDSRFVGALAAMALPFSSPHAQAFPAKPITLICPWPAGGGADLQLRALARGGARSARPDANARRRRDPIRQRDVTWQTVRYRAS